MPDHKYTEKADRQRTTLDFKQRIIDLMANNQPLPEVGIYDEPVRYFKANEQWCAVIFGWLDWLEDIAGWQAAQDENYQGIQEILVFEEGITLPELDCSQIEDCLETSPTITNIENNITNIENNITNITNAQAECCETATNGGNTYPPPPEHQSAANASCEAAAYLAAQIKAQMLDLWAQAGTYTIQEFIDDLADVIQWRVDKAISFYQLALFLSNPSLATSAAAYEEEIKLAFFCAELNTQEAIAIIQNSAIPANEKALWIATIENFGEGQFNEWRTIGSLGATGADCTDGCPWIVVFDFDGSYIPAGDENAIYPGNTFVVTGGGYSAGVGYVKEQDVMTLFRAMPEQCKLIQMVTRIAASSSCLAVDGYLWTRPDGTSEGYTPNFARVLNNTEVSQTYSYNVGAGYVMSQCGIKYDGFFCGSNPSYGDTVKWIRLIGSGAMPEVV